MVGTVSFVVRMLSPEVSVESAKPPKRKGNTSEQERPRETKRDQERTRENKREQENDTTTTHLSVRQRGAHGGNFFDHRVVGHHGNDPHAQGTRRDGDLGIIMVD